MGFNIYNVTNDKKDYSTIIKDQWRNWNVSNKEVESASFTIFKEFAESHLKYLSGGACKLYIYLGLKSRSTGESWYSVIKIAGELGVTPRTVDGWLHELEDSGLILRDKLRKTAISYLLPYSINLINMKMSVDYDVGSETLSKMIERAAEEKKITGSLYRIFHIFQWHDTRKLSSIQLLAVITKKSYKKGNSLYTAYLSYGYVNNPAYVLDAEEITTPLRFNSWFKNDENKVRGIALESSSSLLKYKHQKDALVQLCEIPEKNLSDFKEAETIESSKFLEFHKEINGDYSAYNELIE